MLALSARLGGMDLVNPVTTAEKNTSLHKRFVFPLLNESFNKTISSLIAKLLNEISRPAYALTSAPK
jgi:hypothetical protein